ncbi:MAG TPA: DUF397 domain-containing protein [Actinophytocola sp.]|nr:DUF397 domain-containing protein [Actinophytocola sp.]
MRITDTATGVRDSKNPGGGQLTFGRAAFGALLAAVGEGR